MKQVEQIPRLNVKMKISELNIGQGNVDVSGNIKEIGEIRTFNKFGRELKVANAILEDESGSIKLTLWNDDVDKYKEGDNIKILNGYVNEFQGEKQLTSGKFGKIEKAGEGSEEPVMESEEVTKEEIETPEQTTGEESGEDSKDF